MAREKQMLVINIFKYKWETILRWTPTEFSFDHIAFPHILYLNDIVDDCIDDHVKVLVIDERANAPFFIWVAAMYFLNPNNFRYERRHTMRLSHDFIVTAWPRFQYELTNMAASISNRLPGVTVTAEINNDPVECLWNINVVINESRWVNDARHIRPIYIYSRMQLRMCILCPALRAIMITVRI